LKTTIKTKIVAILILTILVSGVESLFTLNEVKAYSIGNLTNGQTIDLTEEPNNTNSLFNESEYQSLNAVSKIDLEVAKVKESFLKEFEYQIKTRGNIDEEDANELLTIIIEGKTFELKDRIEGLEKDLRLLIIKDKFTFTEKSQKKINEKITKHLKELIELQKEYSISEGFLQEAKEKEAQENNTKKLNQTINEI
jgi:hypothetical protein